MRDVEELLAQRGIDVSYETIHCWTLKFGQPYAHNLRRSRPTPTARWRLDEMAVKVRGQRMYLWRAVDDEGEMLDILVLTRRNKDVTCGDRVPKRRPVGRYKHQALRSLAKTRGANVSPFGQ